MATKNMHTRAEEAFESEMRAIHIVDLASQLVTDGYHCSTFEPLGEFIELITGTDKKHDSLAPLVKFIKDNASFFADVGEGDTETDIEIHQGGELLREGGFFGFAVQFGASVRTFYSATSWGSSWGHYYTQWVYAETYEQAWEMGLAWAASMNEKDLQEAMGRKTGGAA